MSQYSHGQVRGPHDSVERVPPLPAQLAGQAGPAVQVQHRGGSRGWAMWLMCVPMLVVVAVLLVSGSSGSGAVVYALACLGMMAVMMLFVQHGTRR